MNNQIEVVIHEEKGRVDKVLADRLEASRSQIQQWLKRKVPSPVKRGSNSRKLQSKKLVTS